MSYVTEVLDLLDEELPGLSGDLADFYALLVLTTGEDTTNEHVHDAWSMYTSIKRPDHRSLIPFEELTEEVQELDSKYRDGIIRAAKRYRGNS